MELEDVPRTGDMAAAHADTLVIEASAGFLGAPTAAMVGLLKESLYGNHYPGPRALAAVVNNAGIPTTEHVHAYRMAEAAMRIGALNDELTTFRYGAVLEAIVLGMLSSRSVNVRAEIAVGPMPKWWGFRMCEPIDAVVDDPEIEFYECKCDAADIEGRHLTKFREVYDLATEDSRAPHIAFASFSRSSVIAFRINDLGGIERPTYAAGLDELASLLDGKAPTLVS